MKTMWKRLTAAALLTLCVGMLAGCGGEDRVGVVDWNGCGRKRRSYRNIKKKRKKSKSP